MKALCLDKAGDIRLQDTAKPEAGAGQVIVAVKAAGIDNTDMNLLYGKRTGRTPRILGHEFSGEVVNVGKYVSADWIGKRVAVFPLVPCRECPACLSGRYEVCMQYSFIGGGVNGGAAEYVSVPQWNVIELPEKVTYEQAALMEPMAAAVHAMRRLDISPTNTIAVCGLNIIGQFLIMFLLDRGMENIYAIGSKDSEKESAMALGLHESHYFDRRYMEPETYFRRATHHRGMEAYFDCCGENETVSLGLDISAESGQLCVVGKPCSDMNFNKDSYIKILRRQLTLTGSWNSSYLGVMDEGAAKDDWHYVLNRVSAGKICPEKLISHRIPFEKLDEGITLMNGKSEEYSKIMLIYLDRSSKKS